MNEINASKRLREAATNKAEADKIMQARSSSPALTIAFVVYELCWRVIPMPMRAFGARHLCNVSSKSQEALFFFNGGTFLRGAR